MRSERPSLAIVRQVPLFERSTETESTHAESKGQSRSSRSSLAGRRRSRSEGQEWAADAAAQTTENPAMGRRIAPGRDPRLLRLPLFWPLVADESRFDPVL